MAIPTMTKVLLLGGFALGAGFGTRPTCGEGGMIEFDMAKAAEVSCKKEHGCSMCSDYNYGEDCAANAAEHCSEIDCCPPCEDEIKTMFSCEHNLCGPLHCPAIKCHDFDAAKADEESCKKEHGCDECSDFNFGDDCASNAKEHCHEIECCPVCATIIKTM